MTPTLLVHKLFDFYFFILYCRIVDYKFVLVSSIQQADSVMHICVSILFQIPFPFRLLQNIEHSSLCYIVNLCWLSIFVDVGYPFFK